MEEQKGEFPVSKVKVIGLVVALVLSIGCHSAVVKTDTFAEKAVLDSVAAHTISIATIYSMGETEWQKRVRGYDVQPGEKWGKETIKPWQEIVPIKMQTVDANGEPVRYLAYIGSGTIIKDNRAITVSHLFDHAENTTGYIIFAFKDGLDHPVECELLVRGNIAANWLNDYAIIRLKEDLGLPGLKIAESNPSDGEKVIFTGSVGGLAYFTRYGYLTRLQWYFNTGNDGRLHLTEFGTDMFWVCYPGGPGDSGGSVKNVRGEIVGIIAWGLTVHEENYCLINQVQYLWNFLRAAGMENLAR